MNWERLLCEQREKPSSKEKLDDYRTEFERDFDRCIFSTPVRRLQDKAQVFPLETHDAIRTRLTHSLEVSSVSRGLAAEISRWLLKNNHISNMKMCRSIEAIAATCGLIHDLGNPPFGHAGEMAIREWFVDRFGGDPQEIFGNRAERDQLFMDFYKFEGNAQTLRLVSKLQILADFNGLNLTYGTLSAVCKYVAPSHQACNVGNHANAKPGFFASEEEIITKVRKETGTGKARHPIAYLVEAADDIVYSVADIEDGIKKRILNWCQFEELLIEGSLDSESSPSLEEVKKTLDKKNSILHGAGFDNEKLDDDAHASAFRTAAINYMVKLALNSFKENYQEIMTGVFLGELLPEKDSKNEITFIGLLKDIGRKKIYCTRETLKLEIMGRKIIQDLLDLFWEGAEKLPLEEKPLKTKAFHQKICALCSNNYRRVFWHSIEKRMFPEKYHRLQLVTDYICGMTDSFARDLHAELSNGK